MNVDEIRKLRLADPFRPFRLLLRDGRDLPVERPSYLAISPKGGNVAYAGSLGGVEFVKVGDIREAVVDESIGMAGGQHK